ncbi:MAG TPA: hypothetical protein VIK99_09265 [Thermaerobacter sp.]
MVRHRPRPVRPASPGPARRIKSAAEAQRELAQRGWTALWSHVLGETVLIVRDENVPLPDSLRRRYVRYTLREIQLLRGVTPEGLRELHAAKRVFGGEVMPADGLPVSVIQADDLPY